MSSNNGVFEQRVRIMDSMLVVALCELTDGRKKILFLMEFNFEIFYKHLELNKFLKL